MYEKHLNVIFRVIFSAKIKSEPLSDEEIISAFADFTEKLIIWGSSDTIRAWVDFRTNQFNDTNILESVQKMEAFLLALRKDVGNNNNGLKSGDLTRMFVSDFPK